MRRLNSTMSAIMTAARVRLPLGRRRRCRWFRGCHWPRPRPDRHSTPTLAELWQPSNEMLRRPARMGAEFSRSDLRTASTRDNNAGLEGKNGPRGDDGQGDRGQAGILGCDRRNRATIFSPSRSISTAPRGILRRSGGGTNGVASPEVPARATNRRRLRSYASKGRRSGGCRSPNWSAGCTCASFICPRSSRTAASARASSRTCFGARTRSANR